MVKNLPANERDVRDSGSIPGLGKSPGEGNDNPFQYSCLGIPMDRGSLAGYSPWDCKEWDMTRHMFAHSMPTS